MKGTVFSIEEFSVYDGPGIRTTIFLKGCPLRCSWCHNPEGQKKEPEIVRSPNGCVGCGNCRKEARYLDGRYYFTEESIKKCPMNLLRICGTVYESEVLCEKLLKNRRILENGGGVTFSGGEPLMQHKFVMECLDYLEGKLHRAIQTCGYCPEEVFQEALKRTDFFLYDIKLVDEALHKRYTGVSNTIIRKNFEKLIRSGVPCVVRVPLIPGVTDTVENMEQIGKLLKEYDVNYVELLPYNKMAGGKYKLIQREYQPDFDEKKEVVIRQDLLQSYGVTAKVL